MKSKSWAKILVAGALVILTLVVVGTIIFGVPEEEPVARSYNCDVYTEQGCAKFVVASGGEIEIQSGGTLDVQSGSTVGLAGGTINGNQTITGTLDVYGDVSSSTGAFTVTDSVNITGSVDADSTFNADGAATFNSTVDIDGNISSGTGAVTVTDSVNITGAVDCDSTFNADGAATFGSTVDFSGGDITLENDEILSNSTDGVVRTDGQWGFRGYVLDKTASYTPTVAESGAYFTNDGASGEITFTLPAVSTGLYYCFVVNDNQTITIDPNGTDQILSETNAAGDRVQNGAQFDALCILGVTDGWMPVETTGTWADAN
jgi:hypothetical protein